MLLLLLEHKGTFMKHIGGVPGRAEILVIYHSGAPLGADECSRYAAEEKWGATRAL